MQNAADLNEPFGKYILRRRLGVGGMAEVFLAEMVGPGGFARQAAVKRILPNLLQNEDFITAFVSEARLGGQLSHPNIVQTLELGQEGELLYLAMEYVDGLTLSSFIRALRARKAPPPLSLGLEIARQLCDGLAYAHSATDIRGVPLKMVHRDLKPANVLISFHGQLKITDFGVARAESNLQHTVAVGQIKGTVSYMSPEQALAGAIDHRSDLFSLGAILFELFTLEHLYPKAGGIEGLLQAQRCELGHRFSLLEPLPGSLQELIISLVHKDPASRPANAKAVRQLLQPLLSLFPPELEELETAIREAHAALPALQAPKLSVRQLVEASVMGRMPSSPSGAPSPSPLLSPPMPMPESATHRSGGVSRPGPSVPLSKDTIDLRLSEIFAQSEVLSLVQEAPATPAPTPVRLLDLGAGAVNASRAAMEQGPRTATEPSASTASSASPPAPDAHAVPRDDEDDEFYRSFLRSLPGANSKAPPPEEGNPSAAPVVAPVREVVASAGRESAVRESGQVEAPPPVPARIEPEEESAALETHRVAVAGELSDRAVPRLQLGSAEPGIGRNGSPPHLESTEPAMRDLDLERMPLEESTDPEARSAQPRQSDPYLSEPRGAARSDEEDELQFMPELDERHPLTGSSLHDLLDEEAEQKKPGHPSNPESRPVLGRLNSVSGLDAMLNALEEEDDGATRQLPPGLHPLEKGPLKSGRLVGPMPVPGYASLDPDWEVGASAAASKTLPSESDDDDFAALARLGDLEMGEERPSRDEPRAREHEPAGPALHSDLPSADTLGDLLDASEKTMMLPQGMAYPPAVRGSAASLSAPSGYSGEPGGTPAQGGGYIQGNSGSWSAPSGGGLGPSGPGSRLAIPVGSVGGASVPPMPGMVPPGTSPLSSGVGSRPGLQQPGMLPAPGPVNAEVWGGRTGTGLHPMNPQASLHTTGDFMGGQTSLPGLGPGGALAGSVLPGGGQPGFGAPPMGQPSMIQPSMIQPSIIQPSMTQPPLGQPPLGQPGVGGHPPMGRPPTIHPGGLVLPAGVDPRSSLTGQTPPLGMPRPGQGPQPGTWPSPAPGHLQTVPPGFGPAPGGPGSAIPSHVSPGGMPAWGGAPGHRMTLSPGTVPTPAQEITNPTLGAGGRPVPTPAQEITNPTFGTFPKPALPTPASSKLPLILGGIAVLVIVLAVLLVVLR